MEQGSPAVMSFLDDLSKSRLKFDSLATDSSALQDLQDFAESRPDWSAVLKELLTSWSGIGCDSAEAVIGCLHELHRMRHTYSCPIGCLIMPVKYNQTPGATVGLPVVMGWPTPRSSDTCRNLDMHICMLMDGISSCDTPVGEDRIRIFLMSLSKNPNLSSDACMENIRNGLSELMRRYCVERGDSALEKTHPMELLDSIWRSFDCGFSPSWDLKKSGHLGCYSKPLDHVDDYHAEISAIPKYDKGFLRHALMRNLLIRLALGGKDARMPKFSLDSFYLWYCCWDMFDRLLDDSWEFSK